MFLPYYLVHRALPAWQFPSCLGAPLPRSLYFSGPGKAQELQGVTVKTITTDFPELDITAAATEVITAGPQNLQLRRC